MRTQYEKLTDPQWEIIKEYLPVQRRRKHNLRFIVDAILWYLRIGGQWRNLPTDFAQWQSVYYYFRKWQKDGTLERLNTGLNKRERSRVGKEETPSLLSIDSQSVKAAPFIQEAKGMYPNGMVSYHGNKKVNGRKRHILTDSLGLIWNVLVHAANQADGAMAERVIAPLQGYLDRMKKILADVAYKQVFSEWVSKNLLGVELEISSPPPTTQGFVPVKWRWVTERTFGIENFFRRLDKDHEKTAASSEAWILWMNCQVVINRLA